MKNKLSSILAGIFLVAMQLTVVYAGDAPAALVLSEMEKSIVELTNAERRKVGLPDLKANAQLFDAARAHAANMARQQKLEHHLDGKSHSDRMSEAGYKWMSARENIAWNQRSAKEVLQGWMESAGHKVNILAKEITEIGVGAVPDSKGEIYFAQVFGQPQSAAVNLRFSILNATGTNISVDMGTPKPSKLAPNERTRFTLTTSEHPALVILKADDMDDASLQIENGTNYRIAKDGKFFTFKIVDK